MIQIYPSSRLHQVVLQPKTFDVIAREAYMSKVVGNKFPILLLNAIYLLRLKWKSSRGFLIKTNKPVLGPSKSGSSLGVIRGGTQLSST